MIDYASEINRARAWQRRRIAAAWMGLATGTTLGAVGMGALLALGTTLQAVVVLVMLTWFAWSVSTLSSR